MTTETDTASPRDAMLEEETDTLSAPNTVLKENRNADSSLDIMLQEEMGNASALSNVQQEQDTVLSLDGMLYKETHKCTASDKPSDTSLLPDCRSVRQYN